jgi:hypothetical protein
MPTEFTLSQAAIEQSTFAITVSFTDENEPAQAVAPNTGLKWSLIDESTGSAVNSRTNVEVSPPASSVVVILHGADLALLHGQPVEWRLLVVEGTYNGDLGNNLEIKDQLRFPIKDLAKVPN